jgi:WD40 repeat protein
MLSVASASGHLYVPGAPLSSHALTSVFQVGHDNWVRGLVFHPCGKYMLSAADDYKVRIWDLKTGRCVRVLDAHDQFVSCISWGRQQIGDPSSEGGPQTINVIATGSSDKVRLVLFAHAPRLSRA